MCPDCYNYAGAVYTVPARPSCGVAPRSISPASLLLRWGQPGRGGKAHASLLLSGGGVQRRGAVHLHAVVRADGPEGASPTHRSHKLTEACAAAACSVSVSHARGRPAGARRSTSRYSDTATRGRQGGDLCRQVRHEVLEQDPRLDRRIASSGTSRPGPPAHLHRNVPTALELDAEPELGHLHLARHAHRLGLGGHFLTKSRSYSTSFAALREARAQWNEARRHGGQIPEDRVIESHWRAIGAGWANQGESLFASRRAASAGRGPEGGALPLVHPKRVSLLDGGQTAAGGAAATA